VEAWHQLQLNALARWSADNADSAAVRNHAAECVGKSKALIEVPMVTSE